MKTEEDENDADLYHLFRTLRDERKGGTGAKGKTRGKKQKGNFPVQTPREERKRREIDGKRMGG